jgi:uncharacterized protein YjaG (DUF416 family)
MEPAFSSDDALLRLKQLQPHQQVAVGTACCERMLPAYVKFIDEENWGSIEPLRESLDIAWAMVEGTDSEDDLQRLLRRCEGCTPESEDHSSLYTSAAQDAVFAVCALVEYMQDRQANRIVDTLRFGTDSIDLIVQEKEAMDPRDPEREHKILKHVLMQQELKRQRRDFTDAAKILAGDRIFVRNLRERATRESALELTSG